MIGRGIPTRKIFAYDPIPAGWIDVTTSEDLEREPCYRQIAPGPDGLSMSMNHKEEKRTNCKDCDIFQSCDDKCALSYINNAVAYLPGINCQKNRRKDNEQTM